MPVITAAQTKSTLLVSSDVIAAAVLRGCKENALVVLLYYSTYFKATEQGERLKESDIAWGTVAGISRTGTYYGRLPTRVDDTVH